jgi:hypothetical protein
MAKQFNLIPLKTYYLTIDTNLSKAAAMSCLRNLPLIRNISFRVTSETPAGLRCMYFPNIDEETQEDREHVAGVIERALDPVDDISRPRVIFD